MSFIKSKLTAINNNMKNTFKTLLFISLMCGVLGADEIKSVMEGDSVTLQNDDTEILTNNLILWRFEGVGIAEITGGKIELSEDVADGRFRGRLKLDQQTGSLTITNTRTIHSGVYKIQISTSTGRIEKRFTVTVYDSQPVIDPGRSEVMSLSVIEGESVTLNTDIKPHGDELIVWRFGDILIAKDDKENNKTSFYPDERFKERIQLDQTGSLIIRDIRTTDTGEYKLKISSSNRETKHKRFILFVRDEWKTVFMMKGESVTLITDDAHIKTDDVNMYHGETLIAEIRRGKITRLKDEIRERLKLDDQTGSLFITDTRHTDSGVYYLKIINSTEDIIYKRIIVTVSGKEGILMSVMEGDSVNLYSDATPLQKDADVVWRFKNTVIADKKQNDTKISSRQDALDGKFKQNLLMYVQTGSLVITNIRTDQSGVYELKITSSRVNVHQIFYVTVYVDSGSVTPTLPRGKVKELDSLNNATDVGVIEKQGTSSV